MMKLMFVDSDNVWNEQILALIYLASYTFSTDPFPPTKPLSRLTSQILRDVVPEKEGSSLHTLWV
jgi:hypothetical protein